MTLPATPFRKDHTLTGSIVPLLYDWEIVNKSHLLVTLVNTSITPNAETTLTVDTDYTVSGVGNPLGGNVTLASGYTAGWKLSITSNVPYSQDTDFTNQNSVLPEEAERMADKLGRQIKQIVEILARCVKTTVGNTLSPDALIAAIFNASSETEADKLAAAASALTASNAAAAAQAAASLLPLNNYSATTNPTVNDDIADGYVPGSRWLNTVTSDRFVCTNNAAGAAVWAADSSGLDAGDLGNMAFEEKTNYVLQSEVPSIKSKVQNSKSVNYTLVLADAGKHIYHPAADTTPRTWTIPANASVAFPIGTEIDFVNAQGAGAITIAITSDTLIGSNGTTGSQTLPANSRFKAIKVTSTVWMIEVVKAVPVKVVTATAIIDQTTAGHDLIHGTNIASITNEGTGRTRINFTNAYANTNYNVIANAVQKNGFYYLHAGIYNDGTSMIKTTTYVEIQSFYGHSAPVNADYLDVVIFS